MKKRGNTGTSLDDRLSRSDFLRAFGKLAVYAAPAVLLASACGDDVGGSSSSGDGDGDGDLIGSNSSDDGSCSVSASSSFSVSCSSASSESASSECLPGELGCDGASPA